MGGENRERSEILRQDRCCEAELRKRAIGRKAEKASASGDAESEDLPACARIPSPDQGWIGPRRVCLRAHAFKGMSGFPGMPCLHIDRSKGK